MSRRYPECGDRCACRSPRLWAVLIFLLWILLILLMGWAMSKKKSSRLAGAQVVENRAKPKCFREFRGRAPLIETCLEAVRETAGVVVLGSDWRNAVDVVSSKCMKITDLGEQTACITGATEALIKSAGAPATLQGRRKR